MFRFFLVILSMSFFCCSPTSAQKEFFLKGYAGFNASQISGDDLFGFNKFGAYGGLGTGQEFKDNMSWELGLLFSQKGSFSGRENINNFKYLLNVNYIDVPIAYRYFFKIVSFEVGPQFSAMLNYREDNVQGPANDPRKFSRFEVSAFFGVRYDINEKVGIMARFTNSLLPVREHRSGAVELWNRGQYHTVISTAVVLNF